MARIDWNTPLETDEPTPRRVTSARCVSPPDSDSTMYCTYIEGGPFALFVDDNGFGGDTVPRVRNVPPVHIADEALQRMESFVRKLGSCGGNEAYIVEAREIVALLPAPPVDPDLIEARRLAVDWLNNLTSNGRAHEAAAKIEAGQGDDNAHVVHMLRGIKRGRELAGGETA